jgi:hypothetical protein
MGNFSSAFEKADSQWEQIFKCRLESLQRTPIGKKYDFSQYVKKSSKGSTLDKELSIFVKIFEFLYLMAESL